MGEQTQHWASGNWTVTEGKEDEFMARWREWLEWSSQNVDGFISATLIRDAQNPRHFVSFSPWRDAAARDVWKASYGFRDGFAAARALCDDFQGGDFELAVAVGPAEAGG
jgi:heme-degrading monooxygenase HmoA